MATRLRDLTVDEELLSVEEVLRAALESRVELLSTASEHIVLAGGKRIRPRVTLLAHSAVSSEGISRAVPLAAAVELLHTASLVHDDINDNSVLRRGQASVNALVGDGLALLIGDFIFIKLLGLMADFGPTIIRGLAQACVDIIEGETLQLLTLGDKDMTEGSYLQIVSQKTASLFAACARLGAIVAGGTEQEAAALGEYGLNLGMAFQIADDTLDLVGRTDTLGKPVAADLVQGKMSLATLFALRTSSLARQVLGENAAESIQLLRDTGAIDYAMSKAEHYSQKAKDALDVIAPSEATAALCELADFAVAREA